MEENRFKFPIPRPTKSANEVMDNPASVSVTSTEWKKYSPLSVPEEYDLKYFLPLANPNDKKMRT